MGRRGDRGRGLSDPARLMRGVCQLFAYALVAVSALSAGCSSYSTHTPLDRGSRQTPHAADTYTVQRGDTLFAIAWRNGLDYQTVAAWNRIAPPYTIYPGQRILLHAPGIGTPRVTSPAAGTRDQPPVSSGSSAHSAITAPGADPMPAWGWPATGPILRRFDADATGKKGISIGGTHGSLVRAAAPGQVVYAGSGLVGYGRLIIIKHNDTYLSAYGHNRNLLVNEGDRVRSQQVIAEMGSSGTNRIQLHFEIRRKGKPVDPLRYLPRR